MSNADVSTLLDKARGGPVRNSCWRTRVEGRAKDFIEAAEAAGIVGFSYGGLARVLSDDCGFPIGRSAVAVHYNGDHEGRSCQA